MRREIALLSWLSDLNEEPRLNGDFKIKLNGIDDRYTQVFRVSQLAELLTREVNRVTS